MIKQQHQEKYKHLSRQAAIAATFDMKKSFLILLQNQFGITDTDYLNNSFTMATDKNLKMSFTIIKLKTYFKQVIQKEIEPYRIEMLKKHRDWLSHDTPPLKGQCRQNML